MKILFTNRNMNKYDFTITVIHDVTFSAMTKSCEDNTVEDIKPEKEACHTVYEKECKSVYRPQKSKVRNLPFLLPFLKPQIFYCLKKSYKNGHALISQVIFRVAIENIRLIIPKFF